MLEKLVIKNFIIIDDLDINFKSGFNVFTGETGAGKSIIIDAINYLCGNKIDKDVVQKNKEFCIIEGYFTLNKHVVDILDENQIYYDDFLIVTRTIKNDNKSINKINGQIVTLNLLNKIMINYLDIHSQKDGQYLLKNQKHLKILDDFLNNEKLLNDVLDKFCKYNKLENEKNKLLKNEFNEYEIELLQNNIEEIENANLSENEEQELIALEKQSKNFHKIVDKLEEAINIFQKDDGIDSSLYNFINLLNIDDEKINFHRKKIQDNYYSICDDFNEIKKYFSNLDFSKNRIDEIQERLFLYNKLKRKYGAGNIKRVFDYLKDGKEKLEQYFKKEEILYKLNKEIEILFEEYLKKANELSIKRKKVAKKLENLVISELHELELKNVAFEVLFNEVKHNEKGYDNIEFLISLNKGEDLKPLSKVASGGEMSRILLALKNIFGKKIGFETIIFDEIDVGVSGKASTSIAIKMANISKNIQVFAITHSGQVASFANNHYKITKYVKNDTTTSQIVLLNDEESIEEIAQMQNNIINDISIAAAKQLKKEAKKYYGN